MVRNGIQFHLREIKNKINSNHLCGHPGGPGAHVSGAWRTHHNSLFFKAATPQDVFLIKKKKVKNDTSRLKLAEKQSLLLNICDGIKPISLDQSRRLIFSDKNTPGVE